ncbi:uncharacterized protein LOC127002517 isoform X2 [Eriocheir sinensis]|uniref:uncharacterized protein LOC127002517 isoform X2 n=1 Tax=Eriocheir sinensis TaxID=95602 RepID=UPI0021CA8369|nr:uncharacterized protein LOC127002517 isoform X2 [Eriocheir sinensis]
MRTECSKPTAVQCKECGVNFSRLSIYRQHLQQFHNIETTTAQYEFASEEEFMAWKDALEMEVGVNYTSHTGNKKSVDSTKTIYYCRRSGVQKSSKSTHKRAEKSQGTSKMGYYCTSSIEAVRQNGCVQVTYYVEHHEHDINFHSLVHMTLPASVKDKIAGMILRGVSHEHILEQVRKSAGESRAAILESQDIKNIVTQFGLKQEHKRHPDDSTSVRLIVTEYREAGDLLYFKDQNSIDPENPEIGKKEFVLGFIKEEQRRVFSKQLESGQELQICMDSTHCISQYEGYQLTTLMTVTDLNQGFPVAFLISSTVNEAILKVFLGEVKKRLGSLCAKIFMSDDDPMFRNAWNAIMHGDVPQQVLYLNCSWHTDRTFRRNIGSKIKAPLHQKKEIYQMVRALMDEPEEDEFNKSARDS